MIKKRLLNLRANINYVKKMQKALKIQPLLKLKIKQRNCDVQAKIKIHIFIFVCIHSAITEFFIVVQ